MSSTRSQADRHWVQVEVPSDAGNTAFIHLDLNMVDYVSFVRKGRNCIPVCANITCSAVMKPITLKGDDAAFFYKTWTEYIKLKAEAPVSEPGTIHIVGGQGVNLK